MKIGINGYEAVVPRFGFDAQGNPKRVGSSEFCFQILKALANLGISHDYQTYLPTNSHYDLPKEDENWKYKQIFSNHFWTLKGLSTYFYKHKKDVDIFFSPTHYLPLYVPFPSVISILDLSYIYFPDMFEKKDLLQLKLWGKYSLKKSSAIITISESSKNDIIKEYKVRASKVHVVRPGIKEFKMDAQLSLEDLSEKYGVNAPYILFVGTLQPRKNITKLIEAFSLLENQNLQLVIVGRRGWLYEDILKAPSTFHVTDRVKFIENVTDQDLPSFYKNAQVYVLPSLYEGFGLPVLEAMKYDCPVATSNISSLPEAGGDAALYFDPQNPADIANTIEKIVSHEKVREDLIKKGRLQIKKFRWDKAAEEILAVLTSVAQKV